MNLEKQVSPMPIVSHEEDIEVSGSKHSSPNLSLQESTLNGHNIQSIGSGGYAEHGPGIDHKISQVLEKQAKPDLMWSRIRHAMREPFSEFFGVFILSVLAQAFSLRSMAITLLFIP